MKYLLDTTVFLWSLETPERLNKSAMEPLQDDNQPVFLSAVSSWEIVIKSSIGKLTLPKEPEVFIEEALARFSIQPLSITVAHTCAVAELELLHRDPFDRMLVAQAKAENMVLMTADKTLTEYPVQILWCGK